MFKIPSQDLSYDCEGRFDDKHTECIYLKLTFTQTSVEIFLSKKTGN